MNNRIKRLRRAAGRLLCGVVVLSVGPCFRADVAGQFRSGIISAISGFFRIGQMDE